MAENDTQIELKKRARRRLVGAAALALLAAIVLPLVMEHEPKQAGQDIQIRIPSQEGANFASRVIQGAAPAPAKPVVPVEEDAVQAPVIAPSPSEGETVSAPAPKTPDAPVAKVDAGTKPSASPSEKPNTPAVDTARKPEPTAKRDEAERAAAILSGSKPPSAEATTGFVVQLGVFKDSANAASVKAKAKAQGYSAYLESFGDKTRVRAGPFSSREAADAAAAKLRKAGLAAVVTPRA
jgi:DedD protein